MQLWVNCWAGGAVQWRYPGRAKLAARGWGWAQDAFSTWRWGQHHASHWESRSTSCIFFTSVGKHCVWSDSWVKNILLSVLWHCWLGTGKDSSHSCFPTTSDVAHHQKIQANSWQTWISSLSALLVPVTRRTTLGDRAFAVAGPRAWNTLPDFITDCSSLRTFKQSLTTYLFSLSFWAHNNTLFYDCVKRSSSSLCRLRRFKIVRFTLHYITNEAGQTKKKRLLHYQNFTKTAVSCSNVGPSKILLPLFLYWYIAAQRD